MSGFYDVLGISRQAEDDEIAEAYRRYAMAYNPQCHLDSTDPETLRRKFKLASQAYVVLSNPKIRAIYDQYGEEGVRHGGTGNQGVPGGLDIDGIDPNGVFRKFFGVDNPFQAIGEIHGTLNNQHDFFSETAVLPKRIDKVPPLEVKLPIKLEDVFYGAMRHVEWKSTHSRQFGPDTFTDESFEVRVAKGAKEGDYFTIDGKGNTAEKFARGDVIVRLELCQHERFRREGDDLVVVVPITLSEALCGVTVTVQTMEGRQLSLLIDEIVHPKYRSRIAGEGLPRSEDPSNPRGDLIVECATKFPNFLTLEQKSELRRILDV